MRFTPAELAEIRDAFRRRLAAERGPRRSIRRKLKPTPESSPPFLVRDPGYQEDHVLAPGEVAELFSVTSRTVRRWADAGVLPSFRTVGGQRRFRWGEVRRAVAKTPPPIG